MTISGDIDLTLKRDFNREEILPQSIRLKREEKDTSYKRYNEYKDNSFSSTTSSNSFDISFNSSFISTGRISETTSSDFLSIWDRGIRKVEERVCWRKLYKDPKVYAQCHTDKEWLEIEKNRNFPMGGKNDHLLVHYEKLREAEYKHGSLCDRCGRKLNFNNCLSHHYCLCQKCNESLINYVEPVRLR